MIYLADLRLVAPKVWLISDLAQATKCEGCDLADTGRLIHVSEPDIDVAHVVGVFFVEKLEIVGVAQRSPGVVVEGAWLWLPLRQRVT
ncbi:hypothetical protein PJM29_30235, partial [Mycobacterium kansasii]